MHQKTLRAACEIQGIGLHSGKEARLRIIPAPANHGIVFRTRKFLRRVDIPANYQYVTSTKLNTTLGNGGIEISTVEHLLAALAGLEIDNAVIQVTGTEIPVMDGSAIRIVQQIQDVGIKLLPSLRRYLRVLEPIEVTDGDRSAALYPSTHPVYQFKIDYPHTAVGCQTLSIDLTPELFVAEVAPSRTFGFVDELEQMRTNGLAQGAGLDNAIGLTSEGNVLNPEGLRFHDEFVRHKILDAVGDLSLAGLPLLAEYRGVKSGHELHLKLHHALAAHRDRWDTVTLHELDRAAAV